MKDPKLLITIRETSRSFYLFKPKGGGDWRIKFRAPPSLRKTGVKDERITRSLGTPELVPAREKAKLILKSFFSQDDGRAAELNKLRHVRPATLAEIAVAYRDGARDLADKEELKEATINQNIGSLLKLVGGKGANGRRWEPEAFARFDASCLTSDLIARFKQNELAAVRDNPMALEGKKRSVNSTIRQARSIFSKDYRSLYKDLNMPDLTGFMEERACKVDRQATRYVPIPQGKIDAMEMEIRAMKFGVRGAELSALTADEVRARAMYLAFYFMLFLGMRQSEVLEARLEWVEEWPEVSKMAIVRRPYFKPKGVYGSIAIAPQLLQDIKDLSGAKVGTDYLIPSTMFAPRKDVLRYDLSKLVRRHLGDDRTKTCHELRKHAISMQLMRTRNYVDTLKFSRHADVRTLQEHYGSFLDDLPPITSSNWRTA